MSDRAISIADASEQTVRPVYAFPFRRAYVPLATLLLAILLATWLVYEAEPLAAPPPEQRTEVGANPDLTAQESELARAVIQPGFAPRGGREQLLFIGNSQTMAIPYAQPWDISTPQWFQVLLSRQSPGTIDVYRGSLGGMTWPEVVVRIVDFGESVPAPAAVVIDLRPEMFSDLSVRSGVREETRQPAVAGALRNLANSNPNLPLAAHMIGEMLQSDTASQPNTPQVAPWPGRLENALQSAAEGSRLFAQRDLFIEMANITFRKNRNRLFRINSASSRPVESSIYATNVELLREVLQYLHQKGVRTIIYYGPVRSIQPNPNSPASVARIHSDVAEIAKHDNVVLLDYSNLVPESYWTNYEPSRLNQLTGDAGQHDFAHFREEAHRMVAEKLFHNMDTLALKLGDHP